MEFGKEILNIWVLAWEILTEIPIIKTSVQKYNDTSKYCQVILVNIYDIYSNLHKKKVKK